MSTTTAYQPCPQCGKDTIGGFYRCYSCPPSDTYFGSSKGGYLSYGMGKNCCPDCRIRFSVSKNNWISIEPPSYSSLPRGWRHELTITRCDAPMYVIGADRGKFAYF